MIAPEPISTVVKGDRIVLPVDVPVWCGLPGIAKGQTVTVAESFPGDVSGRWILHVTPDEGVTRTLSLSDECMLLVDA